MIMLLSAARKDLIADIMDEMALPFETIPCTNLTKFVNESLAMLGHAKCIICDLESMSDDEDGIVNSMAKIKSLYPELRLIAVSDQEERRALFQRLYDRGIYNLIDAANKQNLKKAIFKGLEQSEVAGKYGTAIPDFTAEEPIKQKIPSVPEEEKLVLKEEIIANKDFKKYEKTVYVGICGTKSGVGTTHFALETVKFLNDIGFRACYLEANEEKKIAALQAYPNTLLSGKGYLQYNGINIYHDFRLSELQNTKYDFCVFDRGVLNDFTLSAILYCPIQILVGNGKVWGMELLQKSVQEINSDKLSVVLNFSTEADRSLFTATKGVYFANTDADPFEWRRNVEIFKSIFAKYITITNEPRAEPEERKKRRFPWQKND